MSVTVCQHADPSQPLALTYRQQMNTDLSFGQVLDCTMGECTFHRDSDTNPVGFVALDSHSVYPFSALNVPYVQVPINELYISLEDLIFVDRTAYLDSNNVTYAYWGPNATNVLRIPDLNDITDNMQETLDYVWAYEGHWGMVSEDISAVSESPIPVCYSSGIDTSVCPGIGDSTMFDQILEQLGIPTFDYKEVFAGQNITNTDLLGEDADKLLAELDRLAPNRTGIRDEITKALGGTTDIVNFFRTIFETRGSVAPRGPPTFPFYEKNVFPGPAQIWDYLSDEIDDNTTAEDAAAAFCERLERPPFPAPLGLEVDILPLISNVIFIIVLCVILTIVNAIFFCSMWRDKTIQPVIEADPETGRYLKPHYKWNNYMFVHAWTYTIALCFCAGGFVIFFIGWTGTNELIEDTIPLQLDVMERWFLSFAVFVCAIDITFLVTIWLRTVEAWRQVNVKQAEIVGEEVDLFYNKKWWYNGHVVDTVFSVSFCGLLVSVVLAVFLVFAGIFNSGIGYGFGIACDEVSSVLTQWCQQLEWLGVPLPCGSIKAITDWCDTWNKKDMILGLWGGFVVLLSHFYMITSAAMATLNFQSLDRALLQYPTHEEYVKVLARIDELERERQLNGELDNEGPHKTNFFQKMYFVGAGQVAVLGTLVKKKPDPNAEESPKDEVVDVDEQEAAPEENEAAPAPE